MKETTMVLEKTFLICGSTNMSKKEGSGQRMRHLPKKTQEMGVRAEKWIKTQEFNYSLLPGTSVVCTHGASSSLLWKNIPTSC